jgi:hypothetical protein
MTTARSIEVPPEGLCFAAPVQLAAASAADPKAPRRFSGVAYGGGVIADHGWWDAVAFDLAGLQAATPMPLLLQHDPDRAIGVIDQVTNDGAQLAIAGRLFTGTEPEADRVAAKADAGMPWQMSVGIFADAIEEVPANTTVTLNGRAVTGKTHVFRRSRVRETSFVALGADGSTSATVFNPLAAARRVPLLTTEELFMPTPNTDHAAELATAVAARDAEKDRADKAEADLAELRGRFEARERTEREVAVKAMLGESFSADAAKPYLDMTAEQFAAVQSLAKTAASKLPPGFTAEQATGIASGAPRAGKVTPEAIHKYRRDNPGASYEQAFAALVSV